MSEYQMIHIIVKMHVKHRRMFKIGEIYTRLHMRKLMIGL